MSDDNHPPFFRSLRFRYGLGLVFLVDIFCGPNIRRTLSVTYP